MSRRENPVQTLATGWRIVGRDAESIAARAAQASLESMDPSASAEALYAVEFTVPSLVRGRSSVEVILAGLTDELQKCDADAPRLHRDEEASRPASRFAGMRYSIDAAAGMEWTGEVVWRSAHSAVAGAAITSHVIIEERNTVVRVFVRITPDDGRGSVRGFVGAGQAQPPFLRVIGDQLPITWMGGPFAAHTLHDLEVDGFVRNVLANPARDLPVAVLAPFEDGTFAVPPDALMWELLGRARLYVIHDHSITYHLSDAVGDKRLSCYWGASRCYFPEWSPHDEPRDHPALVADRLVDPLMRATWLGEIGMWTAGGVTMPQSVAQRKASRERVDEKKKPVVVAAAPAAPHIEQGSIFANLLEEMRSIGSIVSTLANEVERLRTLSAVRSSSNNAIERRLGRLEDILQRAFPDGIAQPGEETSYATSVDSLDDDAGDDEGRVSLLDVVQSSAEAHAGVLVFLDSAFASATDSPYEDPERIRAILDAMARVSRMRMAGELGMSLRDAFGDLGIDYRAAIARGTSAKHREQYRFRQRNGSLVEAEEHIVIGNVYDPRRCLRIYFSSRVPAESRFVIGHVGRHFDVKRTT
jgi:hypothetical protein